MTTCLFFIPAFPLRFCRDAASIVCVCKAAAAAAPASKWHSAVRVCRSGHVIEPASGAFDVTVAPGEDVQAAVDRCPPGGCVLLLPGTHDGPLALTAVKEVHVFGRGRAKLRAAEGALVTSWAVKSTLDGLVIRRDAGGSGRGVWIRGGALRLQACDVAGTSIASIRMEGGADPLLSSCKCVRERAPLPASFRCEHPGGTARDRCEGLHRQRQAFSGRPSQAAGSGPSAVKAFTAVSCMYVSGSFFFLHEREASLSLPQIPHLIVPLPG